MSDYDYQDYGDDYYDGEANPEFDPVASKFKIKEISEVSKQLFDAVTEVNQLVALGEDWSLLLFNYFKWNYQKLLDSYFVEENKNRALKQIHYTLKSNVIVQTQKTTCEVCLDNTFLMKNYCGHSFCPDCWKENIIFSISNKIVFMKCMKQKCQCFLLNSTINKIIEDSPSNKQKYLKALCEKYVTTNINIKFCPGADCNYFIHSENSSLKSVECYCGSVFCFKCKNQVHRPCSCDEVQKWKETVIKQEANIDWIIKYTKVCPFCKKFVQRSMGCNYMFCAPPGGCGGAFCYVCSKSWAPTHSNHFVCNVYKQSSAPQVGKQDLVKIQFYSEKYLSNDHSKKKIKQLSQKLPDYQAQLFNTLEVSLTQSQFIVQALKFACQACDALKWSYAYGFITSNKMKPDQKQLFQFYQGDFQKWKQDLIIRIEQKFNRLMQSIFQSKEQGLQINKQQNNKSFDEMKLQIQKYHKTAQQQMNKLLDLIETQFVI